MNTSIHIPVRNINKKDEGNVCDFFGEITLYIQFFPDYDKNIALMKYIVEWNLKPTKCAGFEQSHHKPDSGVLLFDDIKSASEHFDKKLKFIE